jgi:DNA-binding response OmpR family regulator
MSRDLQTALAGAGYRPILWPDDAQVLERLRRAPPDLLILDIPPDTTAQEWLRLLRIRQAVTTRCLPVVACVSNRHIHEAALRRLGETRCAVLQKPVVAADLLECIREMWMMRVD